MDPNEWTPWLDDMENMLETAREVLEAIEKKKIPQKQLENMKNVLHSMKGLYDMVGMTDSAKAVAEIEDKVHSEAPNLSDFTKNAFKDLFSKTEAFVEFIRANRPANTDELDETLGLEAVFIKSSQVYLVEIEFSSKKSLKSARALAALNVLKRIAKIRNATPNEDDLMLDANFDTLRVEISSFETMDTLYERLQKLPDVVSVSIEQKETKRSAQKGKQSTSIKIATDDLFTLEQSITQLNAQIEGLKNELETVEGLYKLASIERSFANIEKDLQKLRKVSLNSILNQLPTMAQRLAQAEGKEIQVSLQGRYVSINRILGNTIIDPITQIVRNAIIHGIEYPSERTEKGKDPVGHIAIIGKAERGRVIIEISDDGKGIDEKELTKIAKERGINIKGKSREEVLELIFEEGLTTRKFGKKVAGRGIGLSAAKEKITSIGGTIKVKSEKDKGTTFILELPDPDLLTKNLIIKIRDLYYAIPSSEIEEAVIATPSDIILKDTRSGTMEHNSETLPVFVLRNIIKRSDEEDLQLREKEIVLVCRGRAHKVGLMVDNIVDERLLNVRPLNPILQKYNIFEGVISGIEQDLMLVVNPSGIA